MTVDSIELRALRDSTASLIASNPTRVALIKANYERVPGGGVRRNDTEPEAPKPRFFGSVDQPRAVTTDKGEQVLAHFVLVGKHTDNIADGDRFKIGTRTFEVVYVDLTTRDYECKGWVVHRG